MSNGIIIQIFLIDGLIVILMVFFGFCSWKRGRGDEQVANLSPQYESVQKKNKVF
jgi:hypothetical protein